MRGRRSQSPTPGKVTDDRNDREAPASHLATPHVSFVRRRKRRTRARKVSVQTTFVQFLNPLDTPPPPPHIATRVWQTPPFFPRQTPQTPIRIPSPLPYPDPTTGSVTGPSATSLFLPRMPSRENAGSANLIFFSNFFFGAPFLALPTPQSLTWAPNSRVLRFLRNPEISRIKRAESQQF